MTAPLPVSRPAPAPPPGWPVLDPAALQGLAGEVVRTLAPFTEADPAALLADFLCAFGNAVGPSPHAIADEARHGPRLFVVVVGATSTARKGTSRRRIDALLRRSVEAREWAEQRVGGGISTGEGLIAHLAATAEKDRRFLVVAEEFARILKVAGREGSTTSATLREAWDGGELSIKTRADPLRVRDPHVSLIGHITAEELRSGLSTIDLMNGFANRVLFVGAHRAQLIPRRVAVPDDDLARLIAKLDSALRAGRTVTEMIRDDDAEQAWDQLYCDLADEADAGGIVGALLARGPAQLLRLSVAYALADQARTVGVEHLDAARALWDYSAATARYVWGDAIGDVVADRLLAALRDAGRAGLDFTEQGNLFSRHVAKEALTVARALLEGRGLIKTVQEDTGGRPRGVSYAFDRSDEQR